MHIINRRPLLAAMVSVFAVPAAAKEIPLLAPIMPVGPTTNDMSFYGIMTRPGRNGPQFSSPVQLTLPGGTRVFLQIPSGALKSNVLVFSHGELGSPELYRSLFQHWASHGFTVIAPVHHDSLLRNSVPNQAEIRAGTAEIVLRDPEAWLLRLDEIRTCVDALPWIQSQIGVALNPDHIMLAGHSFGAFAASLLMGTEALMPGGRTLRRDDPRFFGALLMSPQGRGILGLHDGSWNNMRGPTMIITGNGDVDITGQSADVKAESFFLSPPGNRHLAWMNGISPPLFSGDQVFPGQTSELIFNDILAVSTCFLRAYGEYSQEILSQLSSPDFIRSASARMALSYR